MKTQPLKKSPQKRFYNRLFISVLNTYLILLVFILILLTAGYSYSLGESRKEMERLQSHLLRHTGAEVDIHLKNIENTSALLVEQALAKFLSTLPQNTAPQDLYANQTLQQILRNQNKLSETRSQSVFYFKESDSVLTSTRRYRSENLDAYAQSIHVNLADFRALISQPEKRGSYQILSTNTEPGEDLLLYLEPIIDAEYQVKGAAITYISPSLLSDMLNINTWQEGSICYMADKKDSFFIYGDLSSQPELLSLSAPSLQLPADGLPHRLSIKGKQYIGFCLPSSHTDWLYIFSVPQSLFYKNSNLYYLLFAILVTASLAAGIFLSWLFSHRIFRPVHSILNKFNQTDVQATFPLALHSIEQTLQSYQSDLRSAKQQLHQAQEQTRNTFLHELCQGRLTEEQIQKGRIDYQLPLHDGQLLLIMATYHDAEQSVFQENGSLDFELLLYASRNVMEELLCANGSFLAVYDAKLLCFYQPCERFCAKEEAEFIEKLHQFLEFHQSVLHVNIHLYVSRMGKGCADIPELFLEVEELRQYKAFWGNDVGELLRYTELKPEITGSNGYSYTYGSLDAEKRFLNLLAVKDYRNAYQLFMEQLDGNHSGNLQDFRRERFKIYGFISSLFEELSGLNSDEEFLASLDSLLKIQSLEDLRKKTDVLFQQIIAYQEQERQDGAPPWVGKVRSYIEEHYSNPSLDVSYLAEVFQMNVSHLSRIYKKVMAVSLLDHIHLIRIARAKELLLQGYTVQESSSAVGYSESRALIRVFKRYEGLTPGQFQELNKEPVSLNP